MAHNVVFTNSSNNTMAWEGLLKDILMKDGTINGALLLSPDGEEIHKCGILHSIRKETVSQFVGLFAHCDERRDAEFFHYGFEMSLPVMGENLCQLIKFRILQKTLHSLYATSYQNRYGLIIINLTFGILIASHSHPITSAIASKAVESFAELLGE